MKILHCNHSNNLMLVIILCTFIIEHITKFIVHKQCEQKHPVIWYQYHLYLCMFVQLWDSLYEVYLDISLDLLVAMWVGDFSSSSACRIVGGTM